MTTKQFSQQIRKELGDLDDQIYQLQTYYLQDTKDAGNILKGFENYISTKTSRGQQPKKQKVENYERLFSLSNFKSKVSSVLGETIIGDVVRTDAVLLTQKRNRLRNAGKKSNGAHVNSREEQPDEEQEESQDGEGAEYSGDDSDKHKGILKKKRISKPVKKG